MVAPSAKRNSAVERDAVEKARPPTCCSSRRDPLIEEGENAWPKRRRGPTWRFGSLVQRRKCLRVRHGDTIGSARSEKSTETNSGSSTVNEGHVPVDKRSVRSRIVLTGTDTPIVDTEGDINSLGRKYRRRSVASAYSGRETP